MKLVNLRELYPVTYEDDVYVKVCDEVYETICEFERQESTSARQRHRRETQYMSSYDNRISEPSASPEESILMADQRVKLFELVMSLPPKQSKRIYETFYLGKSIRDIAAEEGVKVSSVYTVIARGLKNIRKNYEQV